VDSEAATWTMMHLAAAHDDETADRKPFRRIATALAKYWRCKRGPGHAYEALECRGGNGYVAGCPLARRYRDQPVLAECEGSGNVLVVDVLRAMGKDPRSAKQLPIFFESALGQNAIYDAHYQSLATETRQALAAVTSQDASAGAQLQQRGRVLVEKLAVML